jgi:hypothetical protein
MIIIQSSFAFSSTARYSTNNNMLTATNDPVFLIIIISTSITSASCCPFTFWVALSHTLVHLLRSLRCLGCLCSQKNRCFLSHHEMTEAGSSICSTCQCPQVVTFSSSLTLTLQSLPSEIITSKIFQFLNVDHKLKQICHRFPLNQSCLIPS